MRVRASDLDRRITILARTKTGTNADFGGSTLEWTPLVSNLPAKVEDMLPSKAESIADSLSIQRRPCKVWIRYRSDITSDMRVQFGDRIMEIVGGPAELGRRDGLEMACESVSTEGDRP